MITREEAIEAGNKIHRYHFNSKNLDSYNIVYNRSIDSFLKTAILMCVKDSTVFGGKIKVKSPIEFYIVLSAYKQLNKDGFIK